MRRITRWLRALFKPRPRVRRGTLADDWRAVGRDIADAMRDMR